jgi:hypothetical protein
VKRGLALALGVLALAGCQRGASGADSPPALPPYPPPQYEAILDTAIAATAAAALPAISEDERLAVADLLDLWLSAGRSAERAARSLEAQDPVMLSAALLALLEHLDTSVELRRAAYAWLRERSVLAALPRLTLRLKYEKDWVANVDLALTLLRHGSGAGAEALIAILREEARDEPMYVEARARAASALALLPPAPGWTPGDFATDWRRLLDFAAAWRREPWRALAPPFDAGLEAEVWRVLGWLRSQPLRPVDDARFILVRMPLDGIYSSLLDVARDQDRYARDHALETISWIGASFGAYSRYTGNDVTRHLEGLLGDSRLRPRVLEALGAPALPEVAPILLPWLRGTAEESTAAADALLRCADSSIVEALRPILQDGGTWTPEAAFSLRLLCRALACEELAPAADHPLDPAEAVRREKWSAERTNALNADPAAN